jgi:hypothetical protein
MEQSHSTAFSRTLSQPVSLRTDLPCSQSPQPPQLPMRKYNIMYLDRDGQLSETQRVARAHPAYEHAFCVLKQGALVSTPQGFMAVEDVLPGDKLRLDNGSYETVQWRGSIQMQPETIATNSPGAVLTRIAADAMGYNRPSPDLVLGYGARILHRAAGIRRVSDTDRAFIPAADFVDGNNVLSLRPTAPFNVFQFGFAGQRALMVNGVEVETLHPGTAFNLGIRGPALRAYLGLFPHMRSFEDFGLIDSPRLRLRDLELLD